MLRVRRWPSIFSARHRWRLLFVAISLLGCLAAPREGAASRQRQRHLTRPGDSNDRSADDQQQIPRLLHFIYLSGFEAFTADSSKPDAKLPKKYFDSCQNLHQHWDSLFWDEAMGLQLVKEHYSWFLPIWESFDGWGKQAKKSDALRAFIMHHYGGVYLDLDIECYKPIDASLKGYQLVLQGTGDEGFNNAVMASVPGHPFWAAYSKEQEKRSKEGTTDQFNSPMFMSGTLAMSGALRSFIQNPPRPLNGWNSYEYQANGIVRIYAIGEWYVPCYGMDHICNRQFEKEHAEGIWDMTNLYGRHLFAELPRPLENMMVDHYVT